MILHCWIFCCFYSNVMTISMVLKGVICQSKGLFARDLHHQRLLMLRMWTVEGSCFLVNTTGGNVRSTVASTEDHSNKNLQAQNKRHIHDHKSTFTTGGNRSSHSRRRKLNRNLLSKTLRSMPGSIIQFPRDVREPPCCRSRISTLVNHRTQTLSFLLCS